MNSEEQSLIDGLFSRLKQAEADGSPRDVQAEQRIREHVTAQPAAPYYMAQAILVQEAAVKRLDEMNRQLKAELEQARAGGNKAPAQSGGFLSGLFGGRDQAPASTAPTGGGGWREPARGYAPPAQQYQPAGQPGYQPGFGQPQAAAGGGFMRGALQTAAGVAGGMMLAEGLSSLFHQDNPSQEIAEIIRDEPSPASDQVADQGGLGEDNSQQLVSDNNWNSDQGGFSDADYSGDGGGFLSDDDDYV